MAGEAGHGHDLHAELDQIGEALAKCPGGGAANEGDRVTRRDRRKVKEARRGELPAQAVGPWGALPVADTLKFSGRLEPTQCRGSRCALALGSDFRHRACTLGPNQHAATGGRAAWISFAMNSSTAASEWL